MNGPFKITGKVVSGAGKAAYFTQLAWVQIQCEEELGFKPFPGTLNVEISPKDLPMIESANRESGVDLIPPETGFCAARALPLRIDSLPGILVLPEKETRIHEDRIVEVMAPICLREALALNDGAEVSLFLGDPASLSREDHNGPGVRLRLGDKGCPLSLKAIIFDLDGTLLDTIPGYFGIVDLVTDRLRLPPVAREDVADAMQDGNFEWAKLLRCTAEGRREELNAKAMAIVREIAPSLFWKKITLFSGVESLLKAIAGQGAKMGIATSTPRQHIDHKMLPLKKAGLDVLFHTVIAADDVPRKKPAPDPLLACADRMGVAPEDSLYVGDMRMDILAGREAGMTTVGVLTGFDDYRSLRSVNPHLILESAAALQERLTLTGCGSVAPSTGSSAPPRQR